MGTHGTRHCRRCGHEWPFSDGERMAGYAERLEADKEALRARSLWPWGDAAISDDELERRVLASRRKKEEAGRRCPRCRGRSVEDRVFLHSD